MEDKNKYKNRVSGVKVFGTKFVKKIPEPKKQIKEEEKV